MAERHVPAPVVHRSARAGAEKVDQQLLLSLDAVIPAMRPEAAERRTGPPRYSRVLIRSTASSVCSRDPNAVNRK
jgi:hypothetical protein